jgi:hypothetical protein
MSAPTKTSLFQEAIESVERLSLEDQEALIEVVNKRLALRRRADLVVRVREASEDYASGNVKRGSVADFMAAIDSDE